MSPQQDAQGHVLAPPGAAWDMRCPSVREARALPFHLHLRVGSSAAVLARSLKERNLPELLFTLAKQASVSGTVLLEP